MQEADYRCSDSVADVKLDYRKVWNLDTETDADTGGGATASRLFYPSLLLSAFSFLPDIFSRGLLFPCAISSLFTLSTLFSSITVLSSFVSLSCHHIFLQFHSVQILNTTWNIVDSGVNFRVKSVILLRRLCTFLLLPQYFIWGSDLEMTEENLPSTIFDF